VKTYASEKRAIARVEALKKFGIWPAVIPCGDDGWRLSYDPDEHLL
jgi:hypothetical protein